MRNPRVGGSAALCALAGCLWLCLATPASAAPGEEQIPAADGGRMLWATQTAPDDGGPLSYGFVDTDGRRVVPPKYASYSYCRDADGRAARVLASRGTETDLLDLTGEVLATVRASSSTCVGLDHAITGSAGHPGDALVELASGEVVVPAAPGRTLAAVDFDTINVSEASGEYFLDLATGVRIPHPGRVTRAVLEAGAPGVPAVGATVPGQAGELGYVNREGEWAVPPGFDRASAFVDGYAVVTRAGSTTFLDAGLRAVGGDWDRIDPVEVGGRIAGFRVELDSRVGLLDADLVTVVQPGAARIDCRAEAGGACTVLADDGSANLVALPEGTITPLPDDSGRLLGRGLIADDDADGRTRRVQSVDTGRAVTLPAPADCHGVGDAFAVCRTGENRPGVVIDADGELTPFQVAVAVPDPDPTAGIACYWVRAGDFQGFVDERGSWLYRERRPADLKR